MTGTQTRAGSTRWTKQRPDEPGYYWFRQDAGRTPEVVNVELEADGRLVATDLENFWRCMPVEDLDGQWAGPIPEPK